MKSLRVILMAVALGAGVYGLAEETQNRPDPLYAGQVSELTLRVRTKKNYPPARAAEGLWATCRHTVRRANLATPIRQLGPDRFRLVLHPAIGPNGDRRLVGCLQDAVTPGVSAQVVDGPERRAA